LCFLRTSPRANPLLHTSQTKGGDEASVTASL
jgi:hypothetical protein